MKFIKKTMGIHPVQTSETVIDHGNENLRDALFIDTPYFQIHISCSVELKGKYAGHIRKHVRQRSWPIQGSVKIIFWGE